MAHGAILGQKLEDALLVDGSKSMQANLNMNNHKITNVTNGTSNADAVNYSQLQAKLSLSGGTMTGPINMGNNKITNVANGTTNTDVATVGQVNAAVANNVGAIIRPSNDTDHGLVLGPTCIYIWNHSTTNVVFTIDGDEYDIVNSWYNLSGLYSKGLTELSLLVPSGTNTTSIGDVEISRKKLTIRIRSTYCGFAYFQTFDYTR